MPVLTFRDDDIAYTAWLAAHPSGWVVNAKRNPTPAYLKLHRAECPTISELRSRYSRWTTGEYIKVCAEDRADLDAWAETTLGAALEVGCFCVEHVAAAPRPRPQRLTSSTPATPLATATPVLADEEGFKTVEAPGVILSSPRIPPWSKRGRRFVPCWPACQPNRASCCTVSSRGRRPPQISITRCSTT
jgi:hypothetical protein